NGLAQPKELDSSRPKTSPPIPKVAVTAPSQSTCFEVVPWDSGTCHKEITMTAAARGTLIKKAHRQEACSISQPPTTGPRAVVIAVDPDQVPMARPREFSSKHALMMAKLPGTMRAAPIPWIALAPTN